MIRPIPRSVEGHIASTAAIVILSACLGIAVHWRLPGLESYTHDLLTRARGPLHAPGDIAIVAIDEPSIARFGRFPWPRSVMARVIDAIAAAQPKAIALDVLYTDPSDPAEDAALAASIGRAGNVAAAAQLVDAPVPSGAASWLLPLPAIRQAAAATGHVNVLAESDGAARHLLLLAADGTGRPIRALPLEALRIADRLPESAVVDTGEALVIGSRAIPVDRLDSPVVMSSAGAHQVLRPGRIAIDYIGPTGSFAPVTYSVAALLDGAVPPTAFHNRYVLIGATASSAGERFSSPFMHSTDLQGNQHGTTMPGVEVLANALNTILRGRFHEPVTGWPAFFWAAFTAALTLLVLRSFEGPHTSLKQAAALAALFVLLLIAGYAAFVLVRVVPPLAASTVSFASAGLLGLLSRSFFLSARLDHALADLSRAEDVLSPASAPSSAAEAILSLTGAHAAAIFAGPPDGEVQLVTAHGAAVAGRPGTGQPTVLPARSDPPSAFFLLSTIQEASSQILIEALSPAAGVLVLAHPAGRPPDLECLRLASVIACGAIAAAGRDRELAGLAGIWPRNLEDKARTLGRLNAELVERSRFVSLALRSVEDGLVIAGPEGRISFANRRAAAILNSTEAALAGRNLFDRLAECEQTPVPALRESLSRLLLDRSSIEREITIRGVRPRQYILRLSAVDSGFGPVRGIVASISDITRQKELQQTKNDVISLVSHEMRTPLAAIQGMSELLAAYDLEPAKRREMNLAINEEVKRLTRMITEYLNITRLESGAFRLHYTPVRLEALLDRTLLLLEPVAAERRIQLRRHVAADVPAVFADSDLVTRAVENLLSNAIKYSPPDRQVTVTVDATDTHVRIDVADQGYGIPAADVDRVFEKFYRVARLEDADTPGTGLGLALVREIAELHSGSVTIQSQAGAGSTFTLSLPIEGRS